MPKSPPAGQLSLDALFDTTAISSGFTLGGESVARPAYDDEEEAALTAAPNVAFRPPAKNWRLSDRRALAPTWKGRAADNLAAIRLLQELEREDRAGTADEQDHLAKFTAFSGGDLSQSMFRRADEPFRAGWEELGGELEQLVGPEEMAGLARATQYAHYTPEFIIRAMWDALERMGFSGGNVLEPGCGTGLFLATLPEKAASKVALTGIEADPITARIAAKLFPEAWIRAEDFTKARLTERYDVVIGNPPFSDRTVRADDAAGKLHLSLHDYFIARSIERLKPGGIAAFVTSRWTMDKTAVTAREHIAGMADLIGAVRMPQGAMKEDAGTEVVVDVLLFQRRQPGAEDHGAAWDEVVEVAPDTDGEGALRANRYFAEHPEMGIGRSVLGAIGGFKIGMEIQRLCRDKGVVQSSVWLDRTGSQQVAEINDGLTPLGLVSRLEYMLDRFEVDLAEHRRRLEEAEQRLPAYRGRRGETFAFAEELRDKEDELQALEVAMASNERAGPGDEAHQTKRKRPEIV